MKKYNFNNNSFDEIICILDASGSMELMKSAVIEGFNSFIKKQKSQKRKRKTVVTLVSFNTNFVLPNFYTSFYQNCNLNTIYNRVDIKEVQPLTKNNYICDGGTPLFDALGNILSQTSNEESVHSKTVVIITDGEENSSLTWNNETIRQLITNKRSNGWNFMFIGADESCFLNAKDIGLSKFSFHINPSNAGIKAAWNGINTVFDMAINSTDGVLNAAQMQCAVDNINIQKFEN